MREMGAAVRERERGGLVRVIFRRMGVVSGETNGGRRLAGRRGVFWG